LGILSDVRTALEALQAAMPSQRHDEWVARTQGYVDTWRQHIETRRVSDQNPIRPERLCAELSEALPRNAILVADTGFAAMWTASYVELRHREQTYLRAAGSLGWAFPASLGAKCAAPDRPVVAFIGDGGFHYHLSELDTACRLGLNTVTIVNNNGGLAQAVRNLTIAHEGRPSLAGMDKLYKFGQVDFAHIARGYGAIGITVTQPGELRAVLASALAADRPVVIDVKTDLAAQAEAPWVPA
jgi:acetolactate synthase-1/2/3 large subunit